MNHQKSKVCFSANVLENKRRILSSQLDFREVDNLGKYLGFPLRKTGRGHKDFDFIIDNVKSKLAGWKANCLSLAGRLILTKSVLDGIPNYYSQCVLLPERVHKEVDKLSRAFLWGSTGTHRKINLVRWGAVTSPKAIGGLGIRRSRERNLANLAKLNWRFVAEQDKMWASLLSSKYLFNRRRSEHCEGANVSRNWKAMIKGYDTFSKGTKAIVSNGKSTKL